MTWQAQGIAVFGGTFDPIHLGHVIVAEEVRIKLGLDELLFVPAGQPWLKSDMPVSAAEHRLEMVRLATSDNRHFGVSSLEIERPGPSYAVDTVELLCRQLGDKSEMAFLLGSDVVTELPQWKEPQRLIRLCRLVVFARPGFPMPRLELLETAIPGLSQRVTVVEVSQVDISASEIRRRVAQGDSIDELVPRAVQRYILEQGLYREG